MFKQKYPGSYKKQHKKRTRSPYITYTASHKFKNKFMVHFQYNYILPKNILIFFKKFFKKFLKRKKIKFFFKLRLNYMLTSKNKNSRMGKGVGTLNRYAFFKKSTSCFAEVNNVNIVRLRLLLQVVEKRLGVKFLVIRL